MTEHLRLLLHPLGLDDVVVPKGNSVFVVIKTRLISQSFQLVSAWIAQPEHLEEVLVAPDEGMAPGRVATLGQLPRVVVLVVVVDEEHVQEAVEGDWTPVGLVQLRVQAAVVGLLCEVQ